MKKKLNIGTVLILVMTVGLLAAVIYFSLLLQNKGNDSVTQVRKTKASAVTYHLALNLYAPTAAPEEELTPTGTGTIISMEPTILVSPTVPIISPTVLPSTIPTLISYANPTPTKGITPTLTPRPTATPIPTITPFPTMTTAPTPTKALITYHNPSPTLIPVKETGGTVNDGTKKPVSPSPTKIVPTKTETLPETGWFQYTSIFFIVGVTTLFVAFIF